VGLFALVGLKRELTELLGVDVDVVPADSLKARIRDEVLAESVPVGPLTPDVVDASARAGPGVVLGRHAQDHSARCLDATTPRRQPSFGA